MAADLAFTIQLGVILPKMKEKLTGDISAITEELIGFAKAGAREGEEFAMEPVKEMLMKDFDIFLTDSILPAIEKKLNPVEDQEETTEEKVNEEASEEAGE